jgi:hypothetical protein
MKSLKTLIRESIKRILSEKIHGNLAIVYHASNTPPMDFAIYMNQGFKPGEGAGGMYGFGLYTVYGEGERLINSKSGQGFYGKHIYKIRADLNEFLIFDPEPCIKIHGKLLTLREQLKKFNLESVIRNIEAGGSDEEKAFLDIDLAENKKNNRGYSNNIPLKLKRFFKNDVNGLVFTGTHDGLVVVIFDPDRSAYLVSHATTPLTPESEFSKKFGPFEDGTVISRKRAVLGNTQKGTYEKLNTNAYDNIEIIDSFEKRLLTIIDRVGVNKQGIQHIEKIIAQMAEGQKEHTDPEQFSSRLRKAYVDVLLKKDHMNILKLLSIENLPKKYYRFLDPVMGWPSDVGKHFIEMSIPEFTLFISQYAKLVKSKFNPSQSFKLIETVMYSLNDGDRIMKLDTLKKAEIVHKVAGGPKRDPEDLLFVGMVENHLRHNSNFVGFKQEKYPTIDHIAQLILKDAKQFLSHFPEGDAKYGVEFFYAERLIDLHEIRYSSTREGENVINSNQDMQKICFFLMKHNIFSSNIVQKILTNIIGHSMSGRGKTRPGTGLNPMADAKAARSNQ